MEKVTILRPKHLFLKEGLSYGSHNQPMPYNQTQNLYELSHQRHFIEAYAKNNRYRQWRITGSDTLKHHYHRIETTSTSVVRPTVRPTYVHPVRLTDTSNHRPLKSVGIHTTSRSVRTFVYVVRSANTLPESSVTRRRFDREPGPRSCTPTSTSSGQTIFHPGIKKYYSLDSPNSIIK